MIMIGARVTDKAEVMHKVTEEYLYNQLRNPKPNIEAMIRSLRIVRNLDAKQYSVQKRLLPYFVCGIFNPAHRNTQNFAYTETFLVDIDHISDKGLDMQDVRKRIEADSRVLMCFTSPSEDGLKVMFKLKERCYDAGLYSLFYKMFVHQFSVQMNIEQVIDKQTSDVARACFVSIDSNAYYNPQADAIYLNSFVNITNPHTLIAEARKAEQDSKINIDKESTPKPSADPSADVIQKIKQQLNLNTRKTEKQKSIFVPQILNDIETSLRNMLENNGIVVDNISNINYGKKIQMKLGLRNAEINLFYGKRGFSVIQSPRSGTNNELNQLMAELIENWILSVENL